MSTVKRKVKMADLKGVIYVARERKPPFYTEHDLKEVMEQNEKVVRKPDIFWFHTMFDSLPHTIRG